ncbi:MAG: methyl-accepting chemotaxis protein [Pseudomonadota bacterium]
MFQFRAKKTSGESNLDARVASALQVHTAVMALSAEGVVQNVNARASALLGRDQSELEGTAFASLCDDEAAATLGTAWDALKSGTAVHGVRCLSTPTEQEGTILADLLPDSDENGALRSVIVVLRGEPGAVTQHDHAKARLDALEKVQAMADIDLNGTITHANERFSVLLGRSASQFVGEDYRILLEDGRGQSEDARGLFDALRDGRAHSGTFRCTGEDGKDIWISVSHCPVFDAGGAVLGARVLAHDVTALQNKAINSERLHHALDQSQAVMEFDPQGKILAVNANYQAALGYSGEDLIGRNNRDILEADFAKSSEYDRFWRALERGEFQAGVYKRLAKDGSVIWTQSSFNPIQDTDGNIRKITELASDVTPIKRAILTFQQAMSRLAANDLNVRIHDDVPAEMLDLKTEFNASLDALFAVIAGIAERADIIMSNVDQISGAADDLSNRTERQAATLEETAAAIDQVTSALRDASKNAEEAASTSQLAERSTDDGLQTVRRAIEAMNEIQTSSERVSKITDVIDALAFQTNLLALNAGVEAARAGESGRGFAVVAAEVRSLAQRSSEASREIAEVIAATSNQIKNGVELVDASGNALEKISGFVKEILGRVADLANAAKEQSSGLESINTAASELDRVTQQNAAMFEETSAATRALHHEVEGLSASTRKFSLGAADESEERESWEAPAIASPRTSHAATQRAFDEF